MVKFAAKLTYYLRNLLADVVIIFRLERKGEIRRYYLSTSKARAILEFNPKIGLEAGVSDVYSWFTKQRLRYLNQPQVLS